MEPHNFRAFIPVCFHRIRHSTVGVFWQISLIIFVLTLVMWQNAQNNKESENRSNFFGIFRLNSDKNWSWKYCEGGFQGLKGLLILPFPILSQNKNKYFRIKVVYVMQRAKVTVIKEWHWQLSDERKMIFWHLQDHHWSFFADHEIKT